MSDTNNSQSQPAQTTQTPAPAIAPVTAPAQPQMEFIGINTSANVEMFKGGTGAPLETK
jgi:hypothetical protein